MKKYPTIHGLDGVYFRMARNSEWQNICFSDLTDAEKEEVLCGKSEEWLRSLCKILANSLHDIGEQFNIFTDITDNKNEN